MSDVRVGITIAIAGQGHRTTVLHLGTKVVAEKILPPKRYQGALVGTKVIQQSDGSVVTWVVLQEPDGACHDLPLDVWTVRRA